MFVFRHVYKYVSAKYIRSIHLKNKDESSSYISLTSHCIMTVENIYILKSEKNKENKRVSH